MHRPESYATLALRKDCRAFGIISVCILVGASRRHEQAQAEHGQHDSGNHNAVHAQTLLIPNANDELVTVKVKTAIMHAF
jgi:hypothetical protein